MTLPDSQDSQLSGYIQFSYKQYVEGWSCDLMSASRTDSQDLSCCPSLSHTCSWFTLPPLQLRDYSGLTQVRQPLYYINQLWKGLLSPPMRYCSIIVLFALTHIKTAILKDINSKIHSIQLLVSSSFLYSCIPSFWAEIKVDVKD